jgi:secondary thiamine-phosphate synthase enzyme
MLIQASVTVPTSGRGTYEITETVSRQVADAGISSGLCHLFLQHTSASLLVCENADPQVRRDLEAFLSRLAPDGDPLFRHTLEGPDDMPAHVRAILTQTALAIPILDGRLGLGTWQGIYLYEHRQQGHHRQVIVTLIGEES